MLLKPFSDMDGKPFFYLQRKGGKLFVEGEGYILSSLSNRKDHKDSVLNRFIGQIPTYVKIDEQGNSRKEKKDELSK